jgi:hypothetical protein
MNAIYKGHLYTMDDNLTEVKLTHQETGAKIAVSYASPDLIIDPTDDEINNILPDAEDV